MTALCPACGESRSRAAMRVREYAFRRCRNCRSLYVPDRPGAEVLDRLYEDERYFINEDYDSQKEDTFHGYLDYLQDRDHIEAKFSDVLERVERSRPPGKLLDVGAGPGFMLSAAVGRGWQAAGIEINPLGGQARARGARRRRPPGAPRGHRALGPPSPTTRSR